MFKPLLKVIPSLSGNMKIVCPLEGYVKRIGSNNEFDCVVNSAYLNTISSELFDKNINLNLKNNSFEYDVSRFYKYYSNIFYKTCFKYSKVNIPILNETSVIYQSNTDFEFGCKRVSYNKSKNIFGFFAPIYIEGIDDIKNKVFKIKCEFRYETNKIIKYINIPISKIFDKNNNEIKNYLGDYLERYAEKIDDNVIYFSKSYKNIYYGIDLNNGGFVDIEDNISKNLYNKYYTINDFDCIINKGFYRNGLMMKQILSLSFYFDPENLLSVEEKKFYNNTRLYISGKWYDNENQVDFYNFSDNYHKYSENVYKLDFNGSFRLVNTINNIMDIEYPAFNESSSTNYKYINTVSKNYNRWKLKYSSDDLPYIINNNYAFSFNQDSLYMYKEFPLQYNPLNAICKLKDGSKYNMLIDFDNIYNSNNYNLLNNSKKYYKMYDNYYINNFFNIIVKNDESDEYINIFDEKYSDFWGNVNKDGKIYYKGILYDLNNIYKNNSLISDSYKIDKFGVFIEPHFSYQDIMKYGENYKFVKYISNVPYEYSFKYLNNDVYDYFNNFSTEVRNNILVKKVQKYKRFIAEESTNSNYKVFRYYKSEYSAKGFTLKGKNKTINTKDFYWYIGPSLYINNILPNINSEYWRNFDNDLKKIENNESIYCSNDSAIKWYIIIPTIFDLKLNQSNIICSEERIIGKDNIEYLVYITETTYSNIDVKLYKEDYYWYIGDNNVLDNITNKGTRINSLLNNFNIIFNDYNKISFKDTITNKNKEVQYYIIIPNNVYIYSEDGNTLLENTLIDDINSTNQNYYYDLYDLNNCGIHIYNSKGENIYENYVSQFNGIHQIYDNNIYYDLNDIYLLMNLNNIIIDEYLDINSLNIKHNYKILECYNINNIYSDNYKTEENNYSKLIYRQNKFLEYEKIYWAEDKLYFSIYPNHTKYSLLNQYDLFEENINEKIVLYYKSDFIKVSELLEELDKLDSSEYDKINNLKNILNNINLNKYYFINGLYDKSNKIIYTDPIFKSLTEIDNNYGEHYDNQDDNVIYIDPYNLKNVYDNFIKNEDKIYIDGSFDISNNFESSIRYCRFLNNEHIYYYINKLYLDENLSNSNLFDINCAYYNDNEIIGDNSYSIEENVSRTIYIKIRNFNNIIDLNGDSLFSTIVLQDEYIPIRKLGFNDIGELLNVVVYDDEKKYWCFDNELFDDFIEKKSLDGITIIKPKFLYFELFFKKKMYKLNKALYNIILSINNPSSYKDLYLYHLYNQEDYNINYNYKVIDISDTNNLQFLYSNINESLYPYFNNIYEENRSLTKIYSDYFINNITESLDNEGYSYYRYNEPHINMLVYNNDILYDSENNPLQRYIIATGEKDSFAYLDVASKFNCDQSKMNLYDNLCTYTYNGINYGFYYINTYFSNTSTYLNLKSEEMNDIDYVSFINDIDASLINKFAYSYLIPTYKNIIPYMNNNNITKFLLNNSNIVIKPINNKLDNIYKQYPNFDKDKVISYTIYDNKKHKSLELSRYFDNIVPYIHKESSPTSYYLYFKNTNKYIENSKILNNEPYIMHEETSSIYKYVPVSYFMTYTNSDNVNIIEEKKYIPLEYKYYNYNVYYNLDKYFEIPVLDENKNLRVFNEKEMISFEQNQEEIINLFKSQLKDYDELTKNGNKDLNILFLYKKYKVEFNHNFIGLEEKTNNRLYQIKIKFSLL